MASRLISESDVRVLFRFGRRCPGIRTSPSSSSSEYTTPFLIDELAIALGLAFADDASDSDSVSTRGFLFVPR